MPYGLSKFDSANNKRCKILLVIVIYCQSLI